MKSVTLNVARQCHRLVVGSSFKGSDLFDLVDEENEQHWQDPVYHTRQLCINSTSV